MGKDTAGKHERIFGKVAKQEELDMHVISHCENYSKAPTAPVRKTNNKKYSKKLRLIYGEKQS